MNYIADFMSKDLMLVIEVDGCLPAGRASLIGMKKLKSKITKEKRFYNSPDLPFYVSEMKKC